jgi:hypothetical protein
VGQLWRGNPRPDLPTVVRDGGTGTKQRNDTPGAEQLIAPRPAPAPPGDDARAVRRDVVVALYLGHLDDKLWEADLDARETALRPGKGLRIATLDGPPAPLPDIARMLHVAPNRLKDAVQAHKRGGTFPENAMVGKHYVPAAVAEWWPTTARAAQRAAFAPLGEQFATLARRYGENYDAVKTAVRYAEEDNALPEGVKLDDGTYNEQAWLTWWLARAAALTAGTTLKDIAADLQVEYEWLRQRIRAYRTKHDGALPEGVQLPYRRWDKDKFVAEVWPSIRES